MFNTKRIGQITIVLSFTLLVLGAIVHHFTRTLDCSTWPLCYASQNNISSLLHNAHRYLGMIVGISTSLFLYVALKSESERTRKSSIFSFAFLIVQGGLGAVTAIYNLPTLVSTLHFILSFTFLLGVMYSLHHSEKRMYEITSEKWGLEVTDKFSTAFFMLFMTSILGAFIRHSDTMGSCGLGLSSSFLCYDAFWPEGAQSQVHMFYRYLSFLTWGLMAYALFSIYKESARVKVYPKGLIVAAAFVSLSQILGFYTIVNFLSPMWFSAHTISSFLAIMSCFQLYLHIDSVEESHWGRRKFSFIRDLVSLAKPRLATLVMLTALVGILLAPMPINFFRALTGFIAIFLVVAGGCAINCLMEVKIDALMERTKDRPLPAGRMSPSSALLFGIVTTLVGLFLLIFFINGLTALLALTASALYLFAYTPLKQKSVVALYVGAIPGAIPPVMGWTMVTGTMDAFAWFLFSFLFIWQLPHFMAISIYLKKDYDAANIHVYPNEFGLVLTKWGIFLFTVILSLVAYYPSWSGLVQSNAYAIFSTFMSILFTLVAIKLLLLSTKIFETFAHWARVYFFGSIFYLPIVLIALIFLK